MLILPVYQFDAAVSPPGGGGGGNYIAWDFENNLNEYGGDPDLTFNYSDRTNTYNSGIPNGQALIIENSAELYIQNPNVPNKLFLDHTFDWAISFWYRRWANSNNLDINWGNQYYMGGNQPYFYSNQRMGIRLGANSNIFKLWYRYNVSTASVLFEHDNLPASTTGWNLLWIIHQTSLNNPNTPEYKIRMGINNQAGILFSNSNPINHPFNYTFPTFGFGSSSNNSFSPPNITLLDKFVIWKELKTVQDMHDLYNNGAGMPLP